MKRVISILLLVSVLLSCFAYTTAYAADETPPTGVVTGTDGESLYVDFSRFKDVGNHWAKSYLQWAVQNGIMAGTSSTTMTPDGNITRAQMATMITRAFGATKEADISMFVDVEEGSWYADAIAKAVQMGCLSGFGNAMAPNQPVTRQEIAVALVKAAGYVVNDSYNLTKFKDYAAVDSWARPYLSTAVANGLLTGYTNGNLGPKDRVTRAQFVTMLQRVAVAYMTPTATYTSKTVNGSLMVGVGNISLDNMTISQNLFLSDGVGTGSITLDGTQVGNTVYVRGTGPNTVKITNRSNVKNVVLCNPNNAVSLVVDDTSSVQTVTVLEATGSVTLTGNVGDVTVLTGKAPVKFVEADADDVNIRGKLAAVSIDKNSVVGDVFISSTAVGADLEISGTAESLDVNGAEATVSVKGTLNNLSFGDTGDSCKLELAKDCVIKNLDIDTDDLTLELSGKLTTVDITGDDCDITFGGSTEITTLNIDGDDNKITFSSGAKVNKVYTTGDNLEITGKGEIKRIQVDGGKSITITVPNAEVYNKGGSSVYAGEDSVSRGESVTMNSKGTTTVEAEEAEKEENNKPEKPEEDKPATPVTTEISLIMAKDALPSDFGYNSSYSFSTFGSALQLDPKTGKLTGTVKYIEDFKWYTASSERSGLATGFYAPLVVVSNGSTDKGVLSVGEALFDDEAISKGTGYKGRWIAYVALDPMASEKRVTIKFDPDGAGTSYTEAQTVIDYSGVVFTGGNTEQYHYSSVTAAPGLDGAETPLLSGGAVTGLDYTFNYSMSTFGLLETRNSEGKYGYWVGIRVPAFNDAVTAKAIVTADGQAGTSKVYNVVTSNDKRYIDIYVDAGNDSNETGIWTVSLMWYGVGDAVLPYHTVEFKLDTSDCVLAGDDSASLPIAGSVTLNSVTEDELLTYGAIDDFVFNYRVVQNMAGGTVLHVTGHSSLADGYYFPVKVGVEGLNSDALVKLDNGKVIGQFFANGGEDTLICLVPLTVSGNSVFDAKFSVEPVIPGKYSNVSVILDCSSLSTASSGIFPLEDLPAGIEKYADDVSYSDFRGTLTIVGTLLKNTSGDFGFEVNTPLWAAPVSFVVKGVDGDYNIKYTLPSGSEVSLSRAQFEEMGSTLMVVFAEGGQKTSAVSIQLYKSDELIDSVEVYADCELQGFVAE